MASSVRAADKANKPEQQAEQAAREFIKAVKAKDLNAILKAASTPWVDVFEEKVIKVAKDLKPYWQQKLGSFNPDSVVTEAFEVQSYATLKEENVAKHEEETFRKLGEEILQAMEPAIGKDGYLVVAGEKEGPTASFVLVRMEEGKALVVGGPYGIGYLATANRITREAREALDKAEQFELYSLEPALIGLDKPKDGFHGHKVLGKLTIKEAATRKKLVTALKQSVEESSGLVAACFNPRHGIRLTSGKTTIDLVICFECFSAQVYLKDKDDRGFLLTDSAQPTFNKVLKDAGVQLAKKAEE